MDQTRFDDLTRRLGAGMSRRAGLNAALGGLLGMAAGLAALPATDSKAKKHKHGKKRTRMACSPDKPCPAGMNCLDLGGGTGQCICAGTGLPPCGDRCCAAGQTCSTAGGAPRCTCDADGRPACNGACCAEGEVCHADRCQACGRPTDACQVDAHCCAGSRCDAGRCCPPEGAACSADSDCCGDHLCCGSRCGSPAFCEMWGFAAGGPDESGAANRRRKKRTRMPCSAEQPCPAGMTCLELAPGAGQCICPPTPDASGQPPCGSVCCAAGQTCRPTGDGPRCVCTSDGRLPCNGECCGKGYACAAGSCCPELRACGTVCCAEGRECREAQCLVPEGTCRPRGTSCSIRGQQCCGMLTCYHYSARETVCR